MDQILTAVNSPIFYKRKSAYFRGWVWNWQSFTVEERVQWIKLYLDMLALFFLWPCDTCNIYRAEVTGVMLVLWLSPNSWNCKWHNSCGTLQPTFKIWTTAATNYMWNPGLALVPNGHSNIQSRCCPVIGFSHNFIWNVSSTNIISTNITKRARWIFTLFTKHCDF